MQNCMSYWMKTQPNCNNEVLNVTRESIIQCLPPMGTIQKIRRWVPNELNYRQNIENQKVTCEMLLHRHKGKSFLHGIVMRDEKWIYFKNPKGKKLWLSPGEAGLSSLRPNCFVW